MDAFEAFTHGQPDVKPQHRSLYYFLLGYARKRGNVPRFALPYEVGMDGSRIGSWTTYDAAIKALHGWGFIVYAPGANRYKVPVVELTFRNPNGDELLAYWQAYCLAYPVELQNRNPSPVIELQNLSPTPVVELQNCSSTDNSTANPSGDIKKSIRDKENKTTASAGERTSSSEKKLGKRTKKVGAGPAELLPTSCPLADLLNPGGLAARVQQLAEPLTLPQAERLLSEFNLPALRAIFCEMANWQKLLTSSASANLTARNWLNKRPKAETAPDSTSSANTTPPAPSFDVNALFGHNQSAAEGLAQARNTPEYQAFLAREAARTGTSS